MKETYEFKRGADYAREQLKKSANAAEKLMELAQLMRDVGAYDDFDRGVESVARPKVQG